MKTFIRTMALMLVMSCAGTALAKDICVVDNFGGHWRFYKVKSVKPGGSAPLSGVYDIGLNNCPFSGTGLVTTGGQFRVGVTVYCAAPIAGSNLMINLTGTPDYALTGNYDGNLDSLANDGAFVLTPEDCKTAPVP